MSLFRDLDADELDAAFESLEIEGELRAPPCDAVITIEGRLIPLMRGSQSSRAAFEHCFKEYRTESSGSRPKKGEDHVGAWANKTREAP